MTKITIIGAGNVGATIAYTMAVNAIATEIVLIDIATEKALGEAMDISQGTPFCSPCHIYAGSYADAAGSDIVVLTSGVARKPGQTRLDLAQINVNITKSIIPEIVRNAPDAMYAIVANPVDILTYTFYKCSGLPEHRIVGSGTLLETARLRTTLAEQFMINQADVNAYVMGEHGDSMFFPWSLNTVCGVPVEEYGKSLVKMGLTVPEFSTSTIEEHVRTSGASVIARKGATFHAVSASVCHLCKALLGTMGSNLTVSTMMHGEYGVDDVCLSVMNIVNKTGVVGKVDLPLTDEECVKMRNSAAALKEVIKNLNI